MTVFNRVMFPVLLIFLVGYIFQKIFSLNLKPLSTVAIYLLLPFLVFKTFYKIRFNVNFLYLVLTAIIIMVFMIVGGIIVGKTLKYSKEKLNAFLLSTVFPNSGNYGVPIVIFAFGQKSVGYAMTIMVIHNILMGIVGVYIAASTQKKGREGIKVAFLAILKQPMNYVIVPAILLNCYHIGIPENLMKSVSMIGDITIPLIMLILGMQLAEVTVKKVAWNSVFLAAAFRLVISPLAAYLICAMFSLGESITAVIVIMAAMPSAANTTMYAIQFNSEPDLVSTCTLVSTLCSVVTLTGLISIL